MKRYAIFIIFPSTQSNPIEQYSLQLAAQTTLTLVDNKSASALISGYVQMNHEGCVLRPIRSQFLQSTFAFPEPNKSKGPKKRSSQSLTASSHSRKLLFRERQCILLGDVKEAKLLQTLREVSFYYLVILILHSF